MSASSAATAKAPAFLLRPAGPGRQRLEDTTFMGGRARLPPAMALPTCRLCGARLTLFFQVAFPPGHAWEGLSLATFACTACEHDEHLIPELLEAPKGADVPSRFLRSSQKNFRFLVFPTTQATALRTDERPGVRFAQWELVRARSPRQLGSKVGGVPNWLLEDESPGRCDGRWPMTFLLQLEEELRFPRAPGTPAPVRRNLVGDVLPPRSHYELFLGNRVYLFGTVGRRVPLVYAITQVE